MILKILSRINNEIQNQWAFFGPKWFCWLLIFFGFEFWYIEVSFKALGFGASGPGYVLLNYIHEIFLNKNYVLFFILISLVSLPIMSPFIYFPSFLFLLCKVINEEYKNFGILTYLIIFLSPFWLEYLMFIVGNLIKQ